MVRHEIEQGPIKIAYGKDMVTGLFLTVHDSRLCFANIDDSTHLHNTDFAHNNPAEATTDEINYTRLEGIYLQLRTNENGFGKHVSIPIMKTYMERYGVPTKQIEELIDLEKSDPSWSTTACERKLEIPLESAEIEYYQDRVCVEKEIKRVGASVFVPGCVNVLFKVVNADEFPPVALQGVFGMGIDANTGIPDRMHERSIDTMVLGLWAGLIRFEGLNEKDVVLALKEGNLREYFEKWVSCSQGGYADEIKRRGFGSIIWDVELQQLMRF
ncbi:UNVERIFIED_CONTAM: hypothetical protein HDU68_003364 [Siphonaria sp. JEL0065]|nr:hypothetical protein HDU68_003364 [Siphonaria sp. JEL0065]